MKPEPGGPDPNDILCGAHSITSALPLLLLFALIINAGCAKIGDPQPPEVRIPRPAVDLAASQISDFVELTVSLPTRNTDDSPATTLKEISVYRLAGEAAGKETAMLPDDQFMQPANRIFLIPAAEILKYQRTKDSSGADIIHIPDKAMAYSHPLRYAVVFLNKKGQAAGLSNQAYIKPIPIPAPPRGLSSEVTEDAIRLQWIPPSANMDGSEPPRIAGYNIFRSEDPKAFPTIPINASPVQEAGYSDGNFSFDKTYYYAIGVVGSPRNPHAESLLSESIAVVVQDHFPPAPPEKLDSICENGTVTLFWTPSASADVAGYRIYRREEAKPAGQVLQNELVTALSFRDTSVRAGTQYIYGVTAVDTHGNESRPAQTSAETPYSNDSH
jgi:hypothetical protein